MFVFRAQCMDTELSGFWVWYAAWQVASILWTMETRTRERAVIIGTTGRLVPSSLHHHNHNLFLRQLGLTGIYHIACDSFWEK